MNKPLVNLEIKNGIARVVLNRPEKRNALSRELIAKFSEAVNSVAGDASARLLVLTAQGPVFCAGMDLAEMQARAESTDAADEWRKDTERYLDLLSALFELPIPTLAVVQGPALAGGLGLLLACDIVLAAENAFFSLPEPKRGITAAVVTPFLAYRIGAGAATYLLLSGERISAAQAERIGLCHEVVATDRLAERVQELSTSILSGAPSALAKTKQHLIGCAGPMLMQQFDAGMQVSAEARETEEAREGLAAFLEKRAPAWDPKTESQPGRKPTE